MIHTARAQTFEQLSGPLLDMMTKSTLLRRTLVRPPFLPPTRPPTPVLSLLRTVCLYQAAPSISLPPSPTHPPTHPPKKTQGTSPSFLTALLSKLAHPKAVVRKPVLTLLRLIFTHHEKKEELISTYSLYPLMHKLQADESQVLVCGLATQLLKDFDKVTRK